MNTQTQTTSRATKETQIPASIVWFEIPADDVERAKKFYERRCDWIIRSADLLLGRRRDHGLLKRKYRWSPVFVSVTKKRFDTIVGELVTAFHVGAGKLSAYSRR